VTALHHLGRARRSSGCGHSPLHLSSVSWGSSIVSPAQSACEIK
jgi:hypothetical protein